MAWVPSVSPWNSQRIPIVKNADRGQPWPAGEPWPVPPGLEFVAHLDFLIRDLVPSTQWASAPDTDTLAEQEAQAIWPGGQDRAFHESQRDKRRSAIPVVGTVWTR